MSYKARSELRAEMRRVLASLDPRWVQAASSQICQNLNRIVEHDVGHTIRHILAWTSFFPGEVDLSDFIGAQLGKREVYLPRILPDYSMNFIRIDDSYLHHVQAGHLGMPEPDESFAKTFDTALAPLSLVIVPGLAFDERGTRLGRGKGYYDRFFARPHMREAEKVGVCWQLQMVKDLALEPHDVPVDWICHEHYGFKTKPNPAKGM